MAGQNLYQAPSLESLLPYDVNRPGQYEAVKASLYDFTTYAAAGQTQLNFFQIPLGQSGKSLEDTNMETAGTLPAPKHFLVQRLEIFAFPDASPAYAGPMTEAEQVNDVYDLARRGYLDFFIGSKSYLTEAPLARIPACSGLIVSAAMSDASTAAADQYNRVAYANLGGRPYDLAPPILLMPNQNFRVSLNWASVLPISADMRVGVVMSGILYRQSQ